MHTQYISSTTANNSQGHDINEEVTYCMFVNRIKTIHYIFQALLTDTSKSVERNSRLVTPAPNSVILIITVKII